MVHPKQFRLSDASELWHDNPNCSASNCGHIATHSNIMSNVENARSLRTPNTQEEAAIAKIVPMTSKVSPCFRLQAHAPSNETEVSYRHQERVVLEMNRFSSSQKWNYADWRLAPPTA